MTETLSATLQSLDDLLRHSARRAPAAPTLGPRAAAIGFGDLDARVDRIAGALLQDGRPGDRVAILGRNSVEQVELLFGILRAGQTALPINWRLAEREIDYILAHSGATRLFADAALLDTGRAAASGRPLAVHSLDPGAFAAWRDAATPAAAPSTSRDALALLMYTSGTTGLPKGVMLSHGNVLDSLSIFGEPPLHLGPDDVVFAPAPMFHITGIGPVLRAVQTGARLIVAGYFDPHDAVRTMAHEGVTYTTLAPAMIQACLASPALVETPPDRLRIIVYGGSPIAPATLDEARARIGCAFAQCYGLTETTGPVTILTPEDHAPGRDLLLSCGRAPAGVEIAVVDAEGRPLAAGETGEIIVRGPVVMAGYADDAEATAATVRGDWLHSGDAGYVDAEGYVFIRDRVKDMIVSGGENIYPVEVEKALADHPHVADVAVIGIPDEKWGETVLALIVPTKPAPDAAAINAFCREQIAGYKCPRRIEFVDSIPRNAAGKILRRALREPYWDRHERRVG